MSWSGLQQIDISQSQVNSVSYVQTMIQFMWQDDIVSIVKFVVQCLDSLFGGSFCSVVHEAAQPVMSYLSY